MTTVMRLLTSAASAALLTTLVHAQPPRPAPPGGGVGVRGGAMPPIERLRTQLGLSDEQVKQLEALRATQAARPSREPDLLRARADLMQAMQGTGDVAAARKAIERMNSLRTEAMVARLEQRQKMRAILTAEQRTKLDSWRGGRGMRGGRGFQGGRSGMSGGRGRGMMRGGGAPWMWEGGPPMRGRGLMRDGMGGDGMGPMRPRGGPPGPPADEDTGR